VTKTNFFLGGDRRDWNADIPMGHPLYLLYSLFSLSPYPAYTKERLWAPFYSGLVSFCLFSFFSRINDGVLSFFTLSSPRVQLLHVRKMERDRKTRGQSSTGPITFLLCMPGMVREKRESIVGTGDAP
jgi:hypothetical protein